MANKTFLFKGLDVRSNQLEREGNSAKDCSNVYLDANKRLIKRNEYTNLDVPKSEDGSYLTWEVEMPLVFDILDIMEYEDSLLLLIEIEVTGVKANCLYAYDLDNYSVEVVPYNGVNAADNAVDYGWSNFGPEIISGFTSRFVKNGALYFMGGAPGAEGRMYKYDGEVWYPAGVTEPQVEFTGAVDEGTLAGNDWYVRTIRFFIDAQGNQTFGQWDVQKITTAGNITYGDRSVLLPSTYRQAQVIANTAQSITEADLNVACSSTDCMDGQILYVMERTDLLLYRFEVSSVVLNTSVILKTPQTLFNGVWTEVTTPFTINITAENATFNNSIVISYFSREYSLGYQFGDFGIMNGISNGINYDPLTPHDISGGSILSPFWNVISEMLFSTYMEDFYSSEIKGNPPKGIQIREYGEACLLLSETNMYFSDLSLNGTVENFTGFDNFGIGEEEDGVLTGFFSSESFIAAFRERNSYLVTGNVFTGNFSISAYRATKVGGKSPHAILGAGGQCLFLSNRGPEIALENGSMSKIGDKIEPIFSEDVFGLNLDLTKARTVLDTGKEILLMYVRAAVEADDVVMVFDYRSKEWFKFGDIAARGGLLFHESRVLTYTASGNSLYVEAPNYQTNGVTGFWASNFETLGVASLAKRFRRVALFLTSYLSGPIGLKSFFDWKTTESTNVTITPSALVPIDMNSLDPKRVYSNSIQLTSTGTNVLEVDGFEYSFDVEQEGLNDGVR
jgi:hypothetical protein